MSVKQDLSSRISFGPFDADLQTLELRKGGTRLRIPGQSFQILKLLLERNGNLVTRDELRQALWPADTYVDFEHGVNAAVNRLREALGDSADAPHLIETLPRRGYRFIGTINRMLAERSVQDRRPLISRNAREPVRKLFMKGAWRLRPLLVASILLVTIISAYLAANRRSQAATALSISPLTTYPGAELFPDFSPDGNQVAFSWTKPESNRYSSDLYLKQIGSEKVLQLTNHPALCPIVSAWSPDGRSIAFWRASADGAAIFLIPALGGSERRLTESAFILGMAHALSWLPDSKWLAFPDTPRSPSEKTTSASRVFLLNVETLERRPISDPSPDCRYVGSPAVSPSGTQIASVCSLSQTVQHLYVSPLDAGHPRLVGVTQGELTGLAWTRDEHSLLYISDSQPWKVSAQGGRPERLQFAQGASSLAIDHRGDRMAYSQGTSTFSIARLDLGDAHQLIHPPVKVLPSTRWQWTPRISPDRQHIAFESRASGSPEIWLSDADGSNLAQLTSFGGALTGSPSWAPDSRNIVFDSRTSGRVGLFTVSSGAGPPRKLITGIPDACAPSWSRNGQWIYFSSESVPGIWKVAVAGGSPLELSKDPAFDLKESVDGAQVLYVHWDEAAGSLQLRAVSTDGRDPGHEKNLMLLHSFGQWTPAPGGIYLADGLSSTPVLEFIDFATGHHHKVTTLPVVVGANLALDATPDGRTVVYATVDQVNGDLMLVNNFQ